MGLKTFVENLDSVDDSVKGFYKESDNGYLLDAEPVGDYELTNTKGLKSALEKERANVKELSKKTSDFADLDPQKAREAISKVEAMKDWKPEDKVEAMKDWKPEDKVKELVNQRLAEQKALLDKDLMKERTEKEELFKQVDITLRQSEAQKVLSELKGNATLLMPHILSQTQTVKNADGSYSSVVVDAAGNPRVGGNDGSNMTIRQLVENMYADDAYAGAFEGSGNSGTGATGNTNRGAGGGSKKMTREQFEQMSPMDQSKFSREGGTII